jgi:4-alpha-glucanotransferase
VATPSAALTELATAYGVAVEYLDWQGKPVVVQDDAIAAVLGAMGVDASSPASIAAALAERRCAPMRSVLPPCWVVRQGSPAERAAYAVAPVEVWLELEGGPRRAVQVTEVGAGELRLTLPGDLPLGWHTLVTSGGERCARAVTPARLPSPAERRWGFMAQLYSVRSRGSSGIGDLGDLAQLATWSGRELGAGFVLVNPMHAGSPTSPIPPSPYLPSSRRFFDPLYLRVPGAGEVPLADGLLDRDATWAAKRPVLEAEHRRTRDNPDYQSFLGREGEGLRDHATWCALATEHGTEWRAWPVALRDPRSAEVAAARERLADEVDFHSWLQWRLDVQLADAQRAAIEAGMAIGVIHDLAVGTAPAGADAWALQHVLAGGVSVGAPPDAFNQQGQDWSQPPWHPARLVEAAYGPYRQLVTAVLRHAGAIRIDHVLGLFRLWWIPSGMAPLHGTYVQYDREALIGILALEAHRAGALVIGEDLGTVAPGTREYLAERGVFGTSVLWFERSEQGDPLPPETWRPLSLATLTTHDLPTTPAALTGEHIDVRDRLGLLTRPVAEERRVDAEDRATWLAMLRRYDLVDDESEAGLTVALHRYLALTPARLLGISLPDAVGDRRAQNLPGTSDEYPNWRLPLADGRGEPVYLEDLPSYPLLHDIVRVVR